ncbi:hypothetical protein OG345_41735 (plasmid) [Streptomyces sp. NBC_01220]|nr:hypothetical protein OG345_41735 [Streptomyces sp. NBC_01220]
MSPTVEITTKAKTETDEIEVVADLDTVVSTDVMLGCGEDNPF